MKLVVLRNNGITSTRACSAGAHAHTHAAQAHTRSADAHTQRRPTHASSAGAHAGTHTFPTSLRTEPCGVVYRATPSLFVKPMRLNYTGIMALYTAVRGHHHILMKS